MKVTKAVIRKHCKMACQENNFIPTREQQWELFCKVCDTALKEGNITESEHKRWTKVF